MKFTITLQQRTTPIHARRRNQTTMLQLSLIILSLALSFVHYASGNSEFEPKSKWYTRYPHYPDGCSTEEQMNERSIPDLQTSDESIESELLHVTAIIRHGARTPYKEHTCWKGWDEQKWDCELKTMTSPPSQPEIFLLEEDGVENVRIDGEGAMFLFEKNYDALHDPPQLRNTLNGTCEKGQLMLRGYVQELHNGRMLRKTYTKEKNDDNAPAENMMLFDLNQDSEYRPYEEPSLYYRSDDDQRTIMSGQILLRGLFGDLIEEHSEELGAQLDPTIVVHTADRTQDILSPNPIVCPRLQDLYDEAIKSKEYESRFVKSEESKIMRKIATDQLGVEISNIEIFQRSAQDCLMTAICNDHDLPEILDDCGNDDGNQYFDRMSKYSYQPYNYVLRYNDAAYSKLAFGPMWVEILSNILPFIPEASWSNIVPQMKDRLRNPAPKLALFSAHDTTILPVLATLGQAVWDGEDWAPYASMIIVEVHSIQTANDLFPSGKAFRLVYNGLVLTDKVDGCTSGEALCDITALIQRVGQFAVMERDCVSEKRVEFDFDEMKSFMSVKGSITVMILAVAASSIVGSLLTYYYLTRSCPCTYDGRGRFDQAASTLQSDNSENMQRMSDRAEIL